MGDRKVTVTHEAELSESDVAEAVTEWARRRVPGMEVGDLWTNVGAALANKIVTVTYRQRVDVRPAEGEAK